MFWVKPRNNQMVPMPASLRLGLDFSFWKIWVPPTYGLKHAAAQQIFLGTVGAWCQAVVCSGLREQHTPREQMRTCQQQQTPAQHCSKRITNHNVADAKIDTEQICGVVHPIYTGVSRLLLPIGNA